MTGHDLPKQAVTVLRNPHSRLELAAWAYRSGHISGWEEGA